MAHEYTTWAWRMTGLQPSEKLVLLHLADAASSEGVCWPGMQRMARQTGLNERTIRRALRTLEDASLLTTKARRDPTGRRTSNVYRLTGQSGGLGTPDRVARVPEPEHPGYKPPGMTPPPPGREAPTLGGVTPPLEPSVENRHRNLPPSTPPAESSGPPSPARAGDLPKVGSTEEGEAVDRIVAAYNEHRGQLPQVRVVNRARRRKVMQAVRDLRSVDEVAAAMAVAAAEVAQDPFWIRKGYGFDNLLADQRFVAKAETAMNRGTTDRGAARARSIAEAVTDL